MLMLTSKTIETKINNYLTKNNIEFNYKFSEDLKYNKVFQSQLCKADLLEYWSDRLTDCSETEINNILKEEFNEADRRLLNDGEMDKYLHRNIRNNFNM